MASRSKKRKTTDNTGSVDKGYLSKEALRNRLSKCQPNKIGVALLDSVQTATPAELRVIQSLLAPLLESATVSLHCVHCHNQYTKPANHSSACNIEHMEPDTNRWGHNYMHTFPCCGTEVESDFGDEYGDSAEIYCFTGPHTIDKEEVEYYDETSGDGNANIVECKEMGCD
ncbi:hypothetical protein FS749_001248 [Ceratobasidium sp. UAMH 11750]|nr:hypothetical protein FS749_001248 [Ceratobasidium sp. UAMH 11750]